MTPCAYERVRELQRELACSETMAWVLARRGYADPQAAREVLDEPAVGSAEADARFHDPLLLGDMAAAVERIRFAIDRGEQVVVHGDYDADGVCSTTLLVEALEAIGADVRAYLPDRFTNGYGLQLETVEQLANEGVRLIVTVDCGITAVEPIAQARDHGMDVIVCDHHQPGEQLPDALICSTRPSDYPFPELCATAVAGKLAQALGAPGGDAQHELEAIATVADCVPLVGENRQIVRRGLAALRRTQRPGLRALLSACDLHAREVDEEAIAFRLAPRINAVGRIEHPDLAYELLRAEDDGIARTRARRLHDVNRERRAIEGTILDEALAQVESWSNAERANRAYVVSGEGWHEGVVGIVAARLVERFHRPVVVIGWAGALGRGSGRSIDGFDLHAALESCSDVLVRWGGHRAAAGLTIDPARIDELRARMAEHANGVLDDCDLVPVERVDAVLAGDELGMELVEELSRLAPFGEANPRPRLLLAGATVLNVKLVGEDLRHLRCTLSTGGVSAQAIAFGQGDAAAWLAAGGRVDACVRASINRFRGAESLQLEVSRLIPLPTHPPQVLGMCMTPCDLSCLERVPVAEVLARADAPSPLAAADEASAPALEPLLARAGTVDLRHAGRGLAHVTRLATGGSTQLVVCADVSRRRPVLDGPLHPERLGIAGVALASSRCAALGVATRLRALTRAEGPCMVLCDYATLDTVFAGPLQFDAIVVLDPPVTEAQRDSLAAAQAPLHLVFGAAEQRFAFDVARGVANVRHTLGEAWRRLRGGPLSGPALDAALFSAGSHLHLPEAVSHGLHDLLGRGLLHRHGDDALAAVEQSRDSGSTAGG